MNTKELIKTEYENLLNNIKTTNYFKVDMHIHTPASRKDYKVNNRYYEDVSIDELKNITKQKLKVDELNPELESYLKDELMAFLIVYEAFEIKKLNMFIVTDHNNIDWYENIRAQLIFYTQHFKKNPSKFMVLPGVEITCFTGTHIIAIFDVKEYEQKFNYLKYQLKAKEINEDKLFTTSSEIDVINSIYKLGGIVYIPHVDNNAQKYRIKDILDPISGLSKAQVLTNKRVHAIGFSNYEHRTVVENVLNDIKHDYYRADPISYLKDSDAHNIDEIGKKYMYIKWKIYHLIR